MSILGEYQNEMPDLSTLDLEHYERIFKLYFASNDQKEFPFYNILRRINLPDNINTDFLNNYTTPTAIPLTIISYNIYKDIRLWWLIFLLNKTEINNNIFVVPGGTTLKYIKPQFLQAVFYEITNLTIFNGRHY